METTTTAPIRHRGPSLLALAIVFVVLFLASLILGTVLAGGEHFPSPFAPGAVEWFSRHRTAVLAGAFLQFGASVPLGIYTATIVSRMQFFGLRVAGVHIALYGGLSASVFLALSALIQWVLGQAEVASSAAAAQPLLRSLPPGATAWELVARLSDGMTTEQVDCVPYCTLTVSPFEVADSTRIVRSEYGSDHEANVPS